ncbi:MAG: hypothetical protein HQ536_04430, partial [Parcubacteria group bacterium]|nr:hypothetical protein [Parcubacteria group bacterium]
MKFTKEKIFVLILFVATISILLWPMLFDNMVFSQKFVFDESMSFNAYFANHFDDHLPLWFQGHTHGFPGYLSQSGGFMHPLILLLFKLFSYITAYNLLVFFNLLVCGIATYVLARRLKMSIGAGIIASFVYTFSHLSVWAHAISALGSMLTVLPVLMLCVLEMHRARKKLRRYVFILFSILVLGLGWMAGYTEGVLYNVIACFFFALFLDISFYLKNKKEHSCADCFQTTGAMVVIIVLGTLLASPWIISVVNFLGETRRSITPSPTLSEFIGSTSLNFEKIIQAIYPYFSVSHSEYIPFINTDHENGYLYVGILPLFFGFLGLLNWKKNKQSIFFAGFFIFTLLTFLPYLPLNWLIHKLPVFGLFRDYWKWVYVMVFCWAMLAGYGFDLLKETYKTKKFKLFSKIFEGTAFCIVILAFLVNLIFVFFKDKIIIFGQNYFNKVSSENIGLQDASSGVDLSHIYGIITQTINEVSWNVSLLNPYFLGSMIFLLFSALLLLLLRKGWLGLATFKFLSVILVILNLSLLWQGYYKPVSASMLQDPPPTVKFLQELSKKEDFRVIKFPLYTRYNLDLNLEASDYVSRLEFDIASLSPNYNLYYDIDSIYG